MNRKEIAVEGLDHRVWLARPTEPEYRGVHVRAEIPSRPATGLSTPYCSLSLPLVDRHREHVHIGMVIAVRYKDLGQKLGSAQNEVVITNLPRDCHRRIQVRLGLCRGQSRGHHSCNTSSGYAYSTRCMFADSRPAEQEDATWMGDHYHY